MNALTQEDFAAFPIWAYCTNDEKEEGVDETFVSPVTSETIPAEAWSLQVAASFTLADGSRYDGFVDCTTAPEDDLVVLPGREPDQPYAVIFVKGRHAHVVPRSVFTHEEARDELKKALGCGNDGLFPIRYELKAVVDGESEPRSDILV